ncbi:hypothetical protein SAMN05421819_0091 [Bryocella elongata]|uniref:Zinc-ribbon domain-containing protein n=1 Tax=Bryocella elongata TaxID=863522 RepID=A0A1H5S6C4_9BACT|nr:hypothetical protein SAMN05421819_0091 [Bryocella elongata]
MPTSPQSFRGIAEEPLYFARSRITPGAPYLEEMWARSITTPDASEATEPGAPCLASETWVRRMPRSPRHSNPAHQQAPKPRPHTSLGRRPRYQPSRNSSAVSATHHRPHNRVPRVRPSDPGYRAAGYDRATMQSLWCWRCRRDMPMLDEEEYAEIASLHRVGMNSVKQLRRDRDIPLDAVPITERFSAMLQRYEDITGFRETNPNAVLHHRLSLYGPPCHHCGKPLRTPKAKLCGSCMTPKQSSQI